MQTGKTEALEIVVNGAARSLPGRMHVIELLAFLDIPRDRVAVELDGAIVKKHDWQATLIGPGARLEIVQFVGGG